jgi:hypothetical protein
MLVVSHVSMLCLLSHQKKEKAEDHVSGYLTTETYKRIYNYIVEPINGRDSWPKSYRTSSH